MIISKIFNKQSIFIIFIICLFIFIINNNIIETKLKEKYSNNNNNDINNIHNNNKRNNDNDNSSNNNNNNNNNINNRKYNNNKLKNLNFLNEEFPQLYTYSPNKEERSSLYGEEDGQNSFNNNEKQEWSKLPTDIMENKKVCIVTTEIEGPVLGGGIGTAYTALSQKLSEDGHNVTVVLVNKVKKLSSSHWIELYKRTLGIRLVILDFMLTDPMSIGLTRAMENQMEIDSTDLDSVVGLIGCTGPCIRSYRTYIWLSKHEKEFDFIHFHDNGGMAYFSSLSQHQGIHFQSTHLVIGGHGPHLWERTANSANLDDGKHFEIDYLERKSVEYSNWLISPSNYMLNWMKYNRWVLPTNSYVHQNLLPGENQQQTTIEMDELLFKEQHQQQHQQQQQQQTPVSLHDFNELLFFGRLESRKGLDIFLVALETLADLINGSGMKVTFLGSNTRLMDINMMADLYIDSVCNKLNIQCQILIGKSHTEAIQYLTTDKFNKLVIVASPIDNSPNTVLECLTHKLSIIATNVGGIPELIHPADRSSVLFDPKPKSLIRLIKKLKETGVSHARFSTDEWTRQIIWSNWHSVVTKTPLIKGMVRQQHFDPTTTLKKLLTIVLVYDRSNVNVLIKNIHSIAAQESPYFHIEIIICKSSKIVGLHQISPEVTNLLKEYQLSFNITEINQYLLSPFQAWNSKEILDQSNGDYLLFLDPLDYLSENALKLLGQVEYKTGSSIITGSVLFNNRSNSGSNGGSVSSSSNGGSNIGISSIYLGCNGMPGIMYNCYGSNNMMINKLVLMELSVEYPVNDTPDYNSDIENSGSWDFYAQATNNGYTLESIAKNIFISERIEYDPTITYNQELRVLKSFDNVLPSTLEKTPLAIRHFLTSKKLYVNEIINANSKSKECERILNTNNNNNMVADQQLFNQDGQEKQDYMESRNHINMVFIRGHEKSGTSWLKKVVDLHPRIFMAKQEFHFSIIEDGLDKFTSKPWAAAQEPYKSYTKRWYKSFVRNLLLSGVSPSMAPLINWVGEKTPSPLAPIISGSKYVLIVRDGRDVVTSLFWHFVRLGGFENWCGPNQKHLVDPNYVQAYRNGNQSDYFHLNPYHLLEKEVCFRKIASGWAQRVIEDNQVIVALESNPVAHVFSLRYEELHRDPETNRRSLYEFLNLDSNEAEQLSIEDKTIPGGFDEMSDKNKFFRKGEIGDWKNYFSDDNKRWFKEETGNLLIDLGYEFNNNW